MSLGRRLRQPSLVFGLSCLLLLCAASIWNLWFIDGLADSAFHRNQTIWIVLGLIGAGVVGSMDFGFFRRVSLTAYQAIVLLLIGVLVFGREINSSRRWLELGPLNVQPSELMKLSVVLMLADWFDRRRAQASWSLRDLVIPLAIVLVPVVLINRQPDLGTSLCVLLVGLSVMLYEGIRRRTLVAGLMIVIIGVPVAWEVGVIRSYQKGRVRAWWALDDQAVVKRSSSATQAELAMWAVGSGRIAGRSQEEARRSVLKHLPYLHTDFAFAAWAEQFGLAGAGALFFLYGGLLWWALYLADFSRDRFDALTAVGCAALIFWQFFINAGMVIGLLPVVGMTLPLMSYGGSSVLTVLLACGFLLNIALRRKARG